MHNDFAASIFRVFQLLKYQRTGAAVYVSLCRCITRYYFLHCIGALHYVRSKAAPYKPRGQIVFFLEFQLAAIVDPTHQRHASAIAAPVVRRAYNTPLNELQALGAAFRFR